MSTEAIYNRRSIRRYRKENLSREIINQILDAARMAPSGKNRQPWKFLVLSGHEKEAFLAAMHRGIEREKNGRAFLPDSKYGLGDAENTLRIMREAPVTVAVLNTNGKNPFDSVTADERIAEIVDTLSIGAAIENMLLKAEEMGIGTLWIANTCFAYEEMVEYLQTEHQLVGAVAMGYADEAPGARPRKSLEEVVEYRGDM